MKAKNRLIRDELIGKQVRIIKDDQEIEGKVIDETKHTLRIRTRMGEVKIIKSGSTIEVGDAQIQGETIEQRPFERVMNKVK